jgi:hypothetical protein
MARKMTKHEWSAKFWHYSNDLLIHVRKISNGEVSIKNTAKHANKFDDDLRDASMLLPAWVNAAKEKSDD